MKIRICHLYGNLLNTYGDIGNIMAIKYLAENKGYQVGVDTVSLGDSFNPENYDFVFFGGGQDYEQEVVHEDLIEKKDSISLYIESGKLFLAICGGYQLLGQYYYNGKNKKIDGLGIFNHYTVNQEAGKRFVGDIKIKSTLTGSIYRGFENHGGRTFLGEGEEAFGEILEGNGNNGEDKTEGFRYKNTYGTYLHGPLLGKNMDLAQKFLEIIEN